jgi:hypothetical protein
MKKILSLLGGLLLAAQSSQAWVIVPVWECLVSTNDQASSLATNYFPFLTNTWNVNSRGDCIADGKSPMPYLSGLKRYDDTRMLVGISENGIIESPDLITTNLDLFILSTNFPDRSLFWVNPTNGAPMGKALTIGLRPYTWAPQGTLGLRSNSWWYTNYCYTGNLANASSPTFKAAAWSGVNTNVCRTNVLINEYFDYDVSDDGYVYVPYRNFILRYGPDGSYSGGAGGFNVNPIVAFEYGVTRDASGSTNSGIAVNLGRWTSTDGFFKGIHVTGAGTNTIIVTEGGSPGGVNGYAYTLTNCNPTTAAIIGVTNFFIAGTANTVAFSRAIQSPTNSNEIWRFESTYQNDAGKKAEVQCKFSANRGATWTARQNANNAAVANRYITKRNTTGTVASTPLLAQAAYGYAEDQNFHYKGAAPAGIGARTGVPFIVVYQAPNWNSQSQYSSFLADNRFKGAGFGVHDIMTGNLLGSYVQPDITEAQYVRPVQAATGAAADWFLLTARVQVNTTGGVDRPDAAYEVCWGSYGSGYGRYILLNDDLMLTSVTNNGTGTNTITFNTANINTNSAYVFQVTTNLTPPVVWTDVTNDLSDALLQQPYYGWQLTRGGNYANKLTPVVDTNAPIADAVYYRARVVVP